MNASSIPSETPLASITAQGGYEFSVYQDITSLPKDTTTLPEWIEKVKKYNPRILAIRAEVDKGKQRVLKGQLPTVTMSGVFTAKGEKGFSRPSGVFLVDIDVSDNPTLSADRIKKKLESIALFSVISTAGKGVKAGFNIEFIADGDEFVRYYYHFEKLCAELEIVLDKSCKDIQRHCFDTYDPEPFINYDAPLIELPPEIVDKCCDYFPSKSYSRKEVESALATIDSDCDNQEWVKVGMALHHWDEVTGLELWEEWSLGGSTYKEGETKRRWSSFSEGDITIKSLFYMAKGTETELEELNKEYSFVVVGGVGKVCKRSGNEFNLMTIQAFKTLLSNRNLRGDNGTRKQLGTAWLQSENRRTYSDGLVFDPSNQASENKLNLWTGFALTPLAPDDKVNVIMKYIKDIVCSGNDDNYNYLIQWIARGLQHPAKRAGVAVVLQGAKGTGKSTLGSLLCEIWGGHSKVVSTSRQLTGNFNSHLKSIGFIVSNEATFHSDHVGNNALKAMITDPTINIEMKGSDVFTQKNILKVLITANDAHVIASGPDERRYFCLKLELTQERQEYFDPIHKAIEGDDKTIIQMFFAKMLEVDLSNFNIRKYPETDANKDQREASLSAIPRFLLDACDRGYLLDEPDPRWYNRVTTGLLMESLHRWGIKHNKSGFERPTRTEVTQYMKSINIKNKVMRGVARYTGIQLEETNDSVKGYELQNAESLKARIEDHEKI
jgi:hypothetical protein